MRMLMITAICLFCPVWSQAQQNDYQLRLLFHKQVVLGNEQGLAFWIAKPDVTQTEPHRMVLLGGWLHKEGVTDKKIPADWQEFMGGAFVTSDGKIKPLFDIRLYFASKQVDTFNEIMLRPDMVDVLSFVTTPLPGGFRAGLEWDVIVPLGAESLVRKQTLMGPRVSRKVPKVPWLQVATTCFFDLQGGTVVRTNIVATR
jgi:hypothetical protein